MYIKKNNIYKIILIALVALVVVACNGDSNEDVFDLENIATDIGSYLADKDGDMDYYFQLKDDSLLGLNNLNDDDIYDLKDGKTYVISYQKKDEFLISVQEIEDDTGDEVEVPKTVERKIEIGPKFNGEGLNLVDNIDREMSGEPAVSLYTSAAFDDEGELMLDDSQEWVLIAETQDGDYELFNDNIQIGHLDFHVFTIDEDFYITTINHGTANLTVTQYRFDGENFIATTEYNTDGNVNMIHSYPF